MLKKDKNWLKQNSYYGKTQIKVKINEDEKIITLDELFENYNNTYVVIDEELVKELAVDDSENSSEELEYIEGVQEIDLSNNNIFVLDGNGSFVKLNRCLKHKRNNVEMFFIRTRSTNYKETKSDGPIGFEQILVVTVDHQVITKSGAKKKISAIKIGDHLKGESQSGYQDMVVTEITEVDDEEYDEVYNISTNSGTFANGYLTVVGY